MVSSMSMLSTSSCPDAEVATPCMVSCVSGDQTRPETVTCVNGDRVTKEQVPVLPKNRPPKKRLPRVTECPSMGTSQAPITITAYDHIPDTYGNKTLRFALCLLDMIIQELSEQMQHVPFPDTACYDILKRASSLHGIVRDGHATNLNPHVTRAKDVSTSDLNNEEPPTQANLAQNEHSAGIAAVSLLSELRNENAISLTGAACGTLMPSSEAPPKNGDNKSSVVASDLRAAGGACVDQSLKIQATAISGRSTTFGQSFKIRSSQGARQTTAISGRSTTFGQPCGIRSSQVASRSTSRIIESRASRTSIVNLFRQLDTDGSGALSTDELKVALTACGIPKARAQKVVNNIDKDRSGEIDFEEWREAVLRGSDEDFTVLSSTLEERDMLGDSLWAKEDMDVQSVFMLRADSVCRLAWDCYLTIWCIYVALVVPFTNGFESLVLGDQVHGLLYIFELAIDISFFVDLCLNFRTAPLRKDGTVEFDWRLVARGYLSSWFLVDLLSSLPFDAFSRGEISSLRILKILKFPKLARAYQALWSRMVNRQDTMLKLNEILMEPLMRALIRRGGMIVATVLICHWLACSMAVCSITWITDYLISVDTEPSLWSGYLAASYWALTTMSTVGYGDITPSTDVERALTMLAMLIGVTYYGFAMGTLISLVQDRDLNQSAFHDRMDRVFAWLDHHDLPSEMRRGVINYFKTYLREQAAILDEEVVSKIAPALRSEIAKLVIHEDIRDNPLFDNLPMAAVSRIQSILKKASLQQGNAVVTQGEPGIAMYILYQGTARLEQNDSLVGTPWIPRNLSSGDSFGEEILTGVAEEYEYTVVALSEVRLFMLEEEEFQRAFSHMPDVRAQLHENATSIYLASTRATSSIIQGEVSTD